MNVTINPGAALDDAKEIDTIVDNISDSLEKLDSVITNNFPENVNMDWSNELLEAWTKCYDSGIPTALEAMKASAANLRLAVENVLTYSQGQ